jgi:hypothetical protein
MPPILWSHRLRGAACGLVLARESGHVLAWDGNRWLVLLNRRGEVQGQAQLGADVVTGAIAEDGSGLAVADNRGQVSWRARDLSERWSRPLPQQPTALAIDPLGRGLAVADAGSRVYFFDADGHALGQPTESPRPLVHMVFAPSAPLLLAASDFGLVAVLEPRSGRWLWQDAPVTHLGALDVGDGPVAAVSCFSEGVRRYGLGGRPLTTLATPEPCRLVAMTYDGQTLLTGGVFGALHVLDGDGAVRHQHHFNQPAVALAMAPLGEWAALALADGLILGLDLAAALK